MRRLNDVKLAHLDPGDEPTIVPEDNIGVAPAPPAGRVVAEEAFEDRPAEEPEVRVDLEGALDKLLEGVVQQHMTNVIFDAAGNQLFEHHCRLVRRALPAVAEVVTMDRPV